MNIYITSFFKVKELPEGVVPFSAAVYQPKGYSLPKAEWCDIRDERGQWIRPRNFLSAYNPAQAYWDAMMEHYWARRVDIGNWLEEHHECDVALCCWCPYDRAAKRQLAEFGTFICHTGPVGATLERGWGGVDLVNVFYDKDREAMYEPVQK